MSVTLATWIVGLIGVYLAVGVLFSIAFVLKGVGRIDPAAAEGTVGFKLIIVPGVVALWPLLAKRWATGATAPPEEQSPHRRAARQRPAGNATESAL